MAAIKTSSIPVPPATTTTYATPPHSPAGGGKRRTLPPLSTSQEDLSARCRALARSVGDDARIELSQSLSPVTSPRMLAGSLPLSLGALSAASTSSVTSSAGSNGAGNSVGTALGFLLPNNGPLSPRSLPPTPEGGFLLEEIEEEEDDDDNDASGSGRGGTLRPAHSQRSRRDGSGGSRPRTPVNALTDEEQSDRESPARRSHFTRSDSFNLRLHKSPVRQALHNGVSCVAADVWLVEGELLVGSDLNTVSPEETLSSLYLEPLLDLFQLQEGNSMHRRRSSSNIFSHISLSRPFQLHLRLRSVPSITFQYLLHELGRLEDASLLTSYYPNSNMTTSGLVQVVIVGDNVPVEDMQALSPRYVFSEMSWDEFESRKGKIPQKGLYANVVYGFKDLDWDGTKALGTEKREKVEAMARLCHQAELKFRVADVPKWPAHTKDFIRSELEPLSVDYL